MTLLPPDFQDFLRLLHSEDVEYLLVGGYAVGFYGYPRATGDIDFGSAFPLPTPPLWCVFSHCLALGPMCRLLKCF